MREGSGRSCVYVGAECAFAASRIYRVERKHRTLAGLWILPGGRIALIRAKRRAVLLSLIPGLAAMGISGLVVAGWILPQVGTDGEIIILLLQGAAALIAQIFLNLRLVAWFSLRLNWGGLPVALALSGTANLIVGVFFGLCFGPAALMMFILASVGVAIPLKHALHARLESAAADE